MRKTISSIIDSISKEDGIDPGIKKIDELLKDYGVSMEMIYDFDYENNLAPSDDPRQISSQCRADGWNEDEIKEFKTQWERGDKMRQPPIGVFIDGKAFTAVGNHRAESKRRCKQKDKYIIIGDELSSETEKLNLLQKVSALSNSKHTSDKRTDGESDIVMQVELAWASVKNADLSSKSPIGKDDRHWRAIYDAESTDDGQETQQLAWFNQWMNYAKPHSFTDPRVRTRIYNASLTQKTGQTGLLNLTEEGKKKLFEDSFVVYDWDVEKYNFNNGSDIHQISTKWNNRVANSPLNTRRTILDTVYCLGDDADANEVHIITIPTK